MIVALVGCCGPKLAHPAPARELYRSPLFRAARAWAEARADAWGILSARHGLVMPDQVIRPYDFTIRGLRGIDYDAWRCAAHVQLHEAFPGASFIFLAGGDYACDVVRFCPCTPEKPECKLPFLFPLLGMGIGERLRFLQQSLPLERSLS